MSELEFINIFSDNLRDLMIEREYNQDDLARESELTTATISRLLNKKTMPSVRALVNLSLALCCRITDLIPDYDYIH